MPELNYLVSAIFIIAAWIFDTLKDKVEYKYEESSFRDMPFFKPNWQNRYSNLKTLEVKWWARIVPMFIDGPHFFAFLKRFMWLNAVFFAGFYNLTGLSWLNYFGFLFVFWFIRKLEHFVIFHKGK